MDIPFQHLSLLSQGSQESSVTELGLVGQDAVLLLGADWRLQSDQASIDYSEQQRWRRMKSPGGIKPYPGLTWKTNWEANHCAHSRLIRDAVTKGCPSRFLDATLGRSIISASSAQYQYSLVSLYGVPYLLRTCIAPAESLQVHGGD